MVNAHKNELQKGNKQPSSLEPKAYFRLAKEDWEQASSKDKKRTAVILVCLLGTILFLILGSGFIDTLIERGVLRLYHAAPSSFLGWLFSLVAENARLAPAQDYVNKGITRFGQAKSLLVLLLLLATILFILRFLKVTTKRLKADFIDPVILPLNVETFVAGCTLGLTTSVRILGPLAGLLVAGNYLLYAKKKSLPNLMFYCAFAASTAYVTWPFLWGAPMERLIEASKVMANFAWEGEVLFMGKDYIANDLPWNYLPTLIGVQLTEPILILLALGVPIAIKEMTVHRKRLRDFLVVAAWLCLPLVYAISLRPTMYDNFRHSFFIIPPIFIFAGVGLNEVSKRVNRQWILVVLLVILSLPGVLSLWNLHPYEYIYYNSFAGGLPGAEGYFETDYWTTSYNQATEYINAEAPPNAKVAVWGPKHIVRHKIRKDLTVFGLFPESDDLSSYDYYVITTRYQKHLSLLPEADVVYTVEKDDVLLAVVKQLEE
jgi:hypothetical protein